MLQAISFAFLVIEISALFPSPSHLTQVGVPSALATPQDTMAPVWPTDGKIIATRITTSSIDINYTHAHDDSGIVNYKILVNGQWDGMWHMDNSFYTFQMFGIGGLFANATYSFQIIAVDPSGNQNVGPSATFRTAPQACAGYAACLVFRAFYQGSPYPGRTIIIVGEFTNLGLVPIRVLRMNATGDFGSLSVEKATVLAVSEISNITLPLALPTNEVLGMHSLRFTVSWEYKNPQDPYTEIWWQASDLHENGVLNVLAESSNPIPKPKSTEDSTNKPVWVSRLSAFVALYGPVVAIPYGILIVVIAILVVENDRKSREALRRQSR